MCHFRPMADDGVWSRLLRRTAGIAVKRAEVTEELPVGPDYASRNHLLFLSLSRGVDCDHDAKNDNSLLNGHDNVNIAACPVNC